MKTGMKLVRNTSFIFISTVLVKLISVVFIAYAARKLGPTNFGIYALLGTFTFMFSFFTNFGITPMTIREIARHKEDAEIIFNNAFSLRICLALLSYLLLVFVVNVISYSQEIKTLIYLGGLSMGFSTFSTSFRVLYMAFEKMAVPSLISVFTSFVFAMSGILVLYLGYGLMGIVLIQLAGSFLGALVSGFWVRRKFFRYKFIYDMTAWKDMFKQSLPFGLITFFNQANRYSTILLLSKVPGPMAGEMSVGYYNSASSTAQTAMMVPLSFSQAVLPTISANRNNPEIVKGIIDKSTKYILTFVSLPLILATAFFPGEIIGIIFGKQYLPSVPALTILGWTYGLMAFNVAAQMVLSSSREINRFIPWAALSIIINIVLAVPLIMYYGIVGAAVAGLVSTITGTFVRYHLLKSVWGIGVKDLKESNAVFVPAVLILLTAWIISRTDISRVWVLILIVVFYMGLLYFFRVLRYKELLSFRDAFRINIPFMQKTGKRD